MHLYEAMYKTEELRGKMAVKKMNSWLELFVVIIVIVNICVKICRRKL